MHMSHPRTGSIFMPLPFPFPYGPTASYPMCVMQGDCSKAKAELGWVPEITFEELVKDMMKSDIANVDAGHDHL